MNEVKRDVGKEVLEAADRLRTQRPEATNVLLERVGYRALDNLGGRFPRSAQ